MESVSYQHSCNNASDLRPSFASAQSAFGTAATVTVPGAEDISATVIWVPPVSTEYPASEYRRVEPVLVIAVGVDEVALIPRGTVFRLTPLEGGSVADFKADEVARVDSDHYRVVVVAV